MVYKMATNLINEDPGAVSSGMGTGEAQVLAAPKPMDWGKVFQYRRLQYLDHQKQQIADDKKRKELQKWVHDKRPIAKWDIDTQNFYSDYMNELEDKHSKILAETKGNPSNQQLAEINGDWKEANQSVALSNQQLER